MLPETQQELNEIDESLRIAAAAGDTPEILRLLDLQKEVLEDLEKETECRRDFSFRSCKFFRVFTPKTDSGWLPTVAYDIMTAVKNYTQKWVSEANGGKSNEHVWYVTKHDHPNSEMQSRHSANIELDGVPWNLKDYRIEWANQFTIPDIRNPRYKKPIVKSEEELEAELAEKTRIELEQTIAQENSTIFVKTPWISIHKNRQISAAEFKEKVEADPSWASTLTEPIQVMEWVDMAGSKITHLSKYLHFTGVSGKRLCADFSNCKYLKKLEGNFYCDANFNGSGIDEIGEVKVAENGGFALTLTNCKNLKIVKGEFAAAINLSHSNVGDISQLKVIIRRGNQGTKFEGCPLTDLQIRSWKKSGGQKYYDNPFIKTNGFNMA